MSEDVDGEPLAGGSQTDVRRHGDTVLRARGPQSGTVIRLLKHLGERGFSAAPRPVDGGFAPDGRERLTYIEGASPPAIGMDGGGCITHWSARPQVARRDSGLRRRR